MHLWYMGKRLERQSRDTKMEIALIFMEMLVQMEVIYLTNYKL